MVSHRAEAVAGRTADPAYRACRNTDCWCWVRPTRVGLAIRKAMMQGLPPDEHLNHGNPPPVGIDHAPRPAILGRS